MVQETRLELVTGLLQRPLGYRDAHVSVGVPEIRSDVKLNIVPDFQQYLDALEDTLFTDEHGGPIARTLSESEIALLRGAAKRKGLVESIRDQLMKLDLGLKLLGVYSGPTPISNFRVFWGHSLPKSGVNADEAWQRAQRDSTFGKRYAELTKLLGHQVARFDMKLALIHDVLPEDEKRSNAVSTFRASNVQRARMPARARTVRMFQAKLTDIDAMNDFHRALRGGVNTSPQNAPENKLYDLTFGGINGHRPVIYGGTYVVPKPGVYANYYLYWYEYGDANQIQSAIDTYYKSDRVFQAAMDALRRHVHPSIYGKPSGGVSPLVGSTAMGESLNVNLLL